MLHPSPIYMRVFIVISVFFHLYFMQQIFAQVKIKLKLCVLFVTLQFNQERLKVGIQTLFWIQYLFDIDVITCHLVSYALNWLKLSKVIGDRY